MSRDGREGGTKLVSSNGATSHGHLDPTAASTAALSKPNPTSFFGRIRVVVRCRPLQADLEGTHTHRRVHIHKNDVIVCERDNLNAGRSYRFDCVLPPDADQVTTFAEVAPLVDHVLDGFHATVFAYGQTSSGKTFTMDGLHYVSTKQKDATAMVPDPDGTPAEQHGIMPRVIQLLFDRARARQGCATATAERTVADGVDYCLRCSYYQIYNEKITDLLRTTTTSASMAGGTASEARGAGVKSKRCFDGQGLRVRWHKGDVFKVENLFVCSCASPEEMREVLFTGVQQKVVSSHLMNCHSSRSHCVFTIYVECRSRKNGELRSRAELSLVDLAGSEKIGLLSSNPSSQLVKESIDINTSLLALGKVITALSSGGAAASKRRIAATGRARGVVSHTPATHVPYRDSKLTMLLKHALGGNSLTTMIACISPSDQYVEETTSTLMYAGRAKNIRNAPRVNEDATTLLIRQLREEIAQLKAELGYYRDMAAKVLGQQEKEASTPQQQHRCATCKATDTNGEAPENQLVVTNSAALTDAAPPGAPPTSSEMEQLADSLIAACEMLKSMMQVNGELRDAYDAVREMQEAGERREEELNAENLALRERLSVLESIVLQEDDDNNEGAEKWGDVQIEAEINKEVDSLMDVMNAATQQALTCAAAAAEAVVERHTKKKELKGSPPPPSAAPLPLSHTPATPPQTLRPPLLPVEKFADIIPTVPPPPPPLKQRAPSPASTLQHENTSVRKAPLASSDTKPEKTSCAASRTPKLLEKPRNKAHKKKKATKKKHQVLARRLQEYERQYRAPSQASTYDDYYHASPASSVLRLSKPPLAAPLGGVPAIRASAPAVARATAALEDMKATVAKLPREVVPEYVPVSLMRPGMFGALAFCGPQEARAPFERHRADREARLRALQQRQQELYQKVHLAVRQTTAAAAGPPQLPRQLPEESVSPLMSSQSGNTTTGIGAVYQTERKNEKRTRTNGDVDSTGGSISGMQSLYPPYSSSPASPPYPEAKERRNVGGHVASSMAQLREYLGRET